VKTIERLKEEGNRAFGTGNYSKAIQLYEEGLRQAAAFEG
jgi:hypothetical protein